MSSRLQLIALEQEFPAVDPSVVQLVADSCGGRINVIKERLKSMAQDQANNEREGPLLRPTLMSPSILSSFSLTISNFLQVLTISS